MPFAYTQPLRSAMDLQRSGKRVTIRVPSANVFTVEEYERQGKSQKNWTKIGAAFPHKKGPGFSIELQSFPVDGRLVGKSS